MDQQDPKNPRMLDMFRSALDGLPGKAPAMPQIVVSGSHNVISHGGTVYMTVLPGTAVPNTAASE